MGYSKSQVLKMRTFLTSAKGLSNDYRTAVSFKPEKGFKFLTPLFFLPLYCIVLLKMHYCCTRRKRRVHGTPTVGKFSSSFFAYYKTSGSRLVYVFSFL